MKLTRIDLEREQAAWRPSDVWQPPEDECSHDLRVPLRYRCAACTRAGMINKRLLAELDRVVTSLFK